MKLLLSFRIVSFLLCLPTAVSTTLKSRYGLSFDASGIIASRFNSSGGLESEFSLASSRYRELFARTVQRFPFADDDLDETNLRSIFEEDVSWVVDKLTRWTREPPEIATLVLPSIFDSKIRSIAADVTFSNADYATRVVPAWEAACYGYGFLKGRNLRRPITECNGDGPTSLVLLLEPERAFLHAWLVEVDFKSGSYAAKQDRMCKGCGEDLYWTIGKKAYQEHAHMFVHDFVELDVLSKHRREDIRAIVILRGSGTGAMDLGQAALEAVGTRDVRLMADSEGEGLGIRARDPSKVPLEVAGMKDVVPVKIPKPWEVVPYGAAVLARLAQRHPEFFSTQSTKRVPDEADQAEVALRRAREEARHGEL